MTERFHIDNRADLLVAPLADGDPDDLLDPVVVAQILAVAPSTLPGWRNKRIGPPYVYLSARLVRYPRGGLVTWLRSRNAQTDKSPGPPPDVHEARRIQAQRARETGAPRPGLKPKHVPDAPPAKQKLTAAPPAKQTAVKPVVRVKEPAR